MGKLLGTLGQAALISVLAGGIGLLINLTRTEALPWVAPFPYRVDCPEKLDPGAPTIDARHALPLLRTGRYLWVDARPSEDFARDALPGARSLPLSITTPVTAADISDWKRFDAVIVYCDSPGEGLARLLAGQLRAAGLTRVKVLLGGLAALGHQREPAGKSDVK
ncbi:MAG: rhodanese-like domain-containing protein [Deltaproteobacteria bacterium]|nr:rhodanese-like domain-containing protein [Deltaproteobacteria bacterium]